MQIYFFGTQVDESAVWGMALDIPGLRVFERYTEEIRELREFKTPEDILAAQAIFPPYIELCLSHSASPEIDIEYESSGKIKSKTISRPLSIGFRRYNPVNMCLNYCNFYTTNLSSWGAKAALPNSIVDTINSKTSVFRKLKRQIEKAAPAKVGSMPILPDAFDKLKSGEIALWGGGEPVTISSPYITIKAAD